MDERTMPPGWEQWHAESAGPVILTFRPDVFDATSLPPECLPTLTVKSERDPRRGRPSTDVDGRWVVELRLEPEIVLDRAVQETRSAAIDTGWELAAAFAAGELDYRSAYQLPREAYFAQLDDLLPAEARDFSASRG